MLEVRYYDVSQEAKEYASFASQHAAAFSNPAALPEQESGIAWATQEFWGWPLDGSCQILGQEDKVPFWSSSFSGLRSGYLRAGQLGELTLGSQNTELETPAVLEVYLSEPCSIPGFTFVFDLGEGLWCSRLQIRWYLQDQLLQEQQVTPDNARYLADCPVEQFDRAEITFIETSRPGCYMKLQQLYLGHLLIFGLQELKKVSILNEADPTLGELTVDTMTLEIHDLHDRDLNPRKNQQVELYRDRGLELVYYVENCTRQSRNQYTFTCGSAVGQLEDTFLGGMYENAPIEQVLTEILGTIPYTLDIGLRGKTVTGYLPVCTRRQALQQVVFSIGAVIRTRGFRGIYLHLLPERAGGTIDTNTVFLGASMETTADVSRVEVVSHRYNPSEERETLLEENLQGQRILLTFEAPHHSYEVTGGTLLEQGVNHIVLSADGPVTVTAGTYNHSTTRHVRQLGVANGGVSREQIRKVEEATLIGPENVEQLLDRLIRVCTMQQTLQQTIVEEGQYAGEYVYTEDTWGNRMQGYITRMQRDLTTAGSIAKITVMGKRG